MIDIKWFRTEPELVKENLKSSRTKSCRWSMKLLPWISSTGKPRYSAIRCVGRERRSASKLAASWDRAKRKKPKL